MNCELWVVGCRRESFSAPGYMQVQIVLAFDMSVVCGTAFYCTIVGTQTSCSQNKTSNVFYCFSSFTSLQQLLCTTNTHTCHVCLVM